MSGEPVDYLVFVLVTLTAVMNVVTVWFLHRISKRITGGRPPIIGKDFR